MCSSYSIAATGSAKSMLFTSNGWNEWMAWTYESIERPCISRCDPPSFTVWQSRQAVTPEAAQEPIEALPNDVLVYLLGSRYCETEALADMAWSEFGRTEPGWMRVQAIVDYVHEHLTFSYAAARSTRTAFEAHHERLGVCRDFAHLAIALCRCMNIPARYCTGYLGDIGVPPVPTPMDFSAWFEVFLGGRWRTFDARHNVPRIGRICMARGRDATDAAITTAFGRADLVAFTVITEEAAVEAPRLAAVAEPDPEPVDDRRGGADWGHSSETRRSPS